MKLKHVVILVSLILVSLTYASDVKAAKVSVDTYAELKAALEAKETNTVELTKTITISKKIVVSGIKTLRGNGYTLRRKTKSGDTYKGVLLQVGNTTNNVKATLHLNDVICHGSCDSPSLQNGVSSRLIEVSVSGSICNITDCILKQNKDDGKGVDSGGAIAVGSHTKVTVKSGTRIYQNEAGIGGGAIKVKRYGELIVEGGAIYNNRAFISGKVTTTLEDSGGRGGAIHNEGQCRITGGDIYDNEVTSYKEGGQEYGGFGGGIYNIGSLSIEGGNIYRNNAQIGGGGVCNSTKSAEFKLTGGTIFDNQAALGGGLYGEDACTINLQSGYLKDNTATGDGGGGVYVSNKAKVNVGTVYIENNHAANAGGGIFNNNQSVIQINGAYIRNNVAGTGGGIYNSKNNSKVTVTNAEVASNRATQSTKYGGGGLRNNGGQVYIKGGKFSNNVSQTNLLAGAEVTNSGEGALLELSGSSTMTTSSKCAVLNFSTLNIKDSTTISAGQYDIRHLDGKLAVQGTGYHQKIYLGKEMYVEVSASLMNKHCIELEVEDYYVGRLLVKSGYTQGYASDFFSYFDFVKQRNHYMRLDDRNIYIGSYYCSINYFANGGEGEMEPSMFVYYERFCLPKCSFTRKDHVFLGWSMNVYTSGKRSYVSYTDQQNVINKFEPEKQVNLYAVWRKIPTIDFSTLTVEEGEYWNEQVWMHNVSSYDEEGNNITSKIICTNSNLVTTDLPGTYPLIYKVTDDEGIAQTSTRLMTVLTNDPPSVKYEERYLFYNELKTYSTSKIKLYMLNSLECSDDYDIGKDLVQTAKLDVSELSKCTGGTVNVRVTVTDQYGHRAYMKTGEIKRYGIGKSTSVLIPVHVILPDSILPVKRQPRFISSAYLSTLAGTSIWRTKEYRQLLEISLKQTGEQCEEEWVFTCEDMNEAKTMLIKQKDIGNKLFRLEFLERFSTCKRKEVTK